MTQQTEPKAGAPQVVTALRELTELFERLTDAVDREMEGIGGEGSLTVLRECGPAYERARAALRTPSPPQADERLREALAALRAVKACEQTAPPERFVNLAHLRKAMLLVDAALQPKEPTNERG